MKALDTPEGLAVRIWLAGKDIAKRAFGAQAIRARDEQIAELCKAKADEADREAEAHEAQITGEHGHLVSDARHQERAYRCEGQASAFRALAAMLGHPSSR